jgi:hypothetical protein
MRRRSMGILSGLVLLIAACSDRPASGRSSPAGVATLFEGARLITGDGNAPIEDSAFVVENGKFTMVGRRGEVQAVTEADRIGLAGKT